MSDALRKLVTVKPLEWGPGGAAKTPFGTYYVGDGRDFKKPMQFYCAFEGENGTWHPIIEAAKAAAQADYEARIRAALIPRPAEPARAAQVERRLFPILKGEGAKIDYQLVADHAEQARKNHYQSVERLAERGGLSWCELYAVLHNRGWEKIDDNEAIIACRALEARYLAAAQEGRE